MALNFLKRKKMITLRTFGTQRIGSRRHPSFSVRIIKHLPLPPINSYRSGDKKTISGR